MINLIKKLFNLNNINSGKEVNHIVRYRGINYGYRSIRDFPIGVRRYFHTEDHINYFVESAVTEQFRVEEVVRYLEQTAANVTFELNV